ncbi:hypothetical protein Y1Q_0015870 [Alligator mississippiensis]|uniref:Uncharacterized protein n=1 Tax=Alligator mississippiensis TaxID=8496 RepID=A0A151MHA3_ALLMI|nr:hypothetical protein Y1Q_0015870 [Alligator mississippiensis]
MAIILREEKKTKILITKVSQPKQEKEGESTEDKALSLLYASTTLKRFFDYILLLKNKLMVLQAIMLLNFLNFYRKV